MKEFLSKNFAIVLAFALPIALIIIVALTTYLPFVTLTTNYDFIYATCSAGVDYYPPECNNFLRGHYGVANNKILVQDIDPNQDSDNDKVPDINENYVTRLFLHDTQKNESREITLEEARNMALNSLLTSPDGVTVSSGYNREADFFFIFDGDSSYNFYLTKGKSRSKLNLINTDDRYYYRDNFHFIGWVLQ